MNLKKIIILNRVTDKLFKLIEALEDKTLAHTTLIVNSDSLDKKSKIRAFFEKSKIQISHKFSYYIYLKKYKILFLKTSYN